MTKILSGFLLSTVLLLTANAFAQSEDQTEGQEAQAAEAATEGAQSQKMPVVVEEVQPQTLTVQQDLPGRISAYKTAEVRARVSGIIEERVFEEGTLVEKGDVLFKIEDESLNATYLARKADLANAEAVAQLSEATRKRYGQLLQSGSVSQQEYDTYASQATQSNAQVEQAKANAEIARINLEYATVTAPISGRIDKAMVTEGALTQAGTTQLATIEQIEQVYVDFTRSSSELQRIRQAFESGGVSSTSDNTIEILFDDGTVYPKKGKLEFSSMSVDPDTGSISLRAVVDNPDQALLPGMFVRVKVPVAQSDNVIVIPQKAVQVTPHGTVVNVVEDDKLKPVPVVLGGMRDQGWIVKSGLKAGDRIVVSDTTIASSSGAPVVGMTTEEMRAAGMIPAENAEGATGSEPTAETPAGEAADSMTQSNDT